MKHWSHGPMVGFDTETTGVDPRSDRILSAAVVYSPKPGEFKRHEFLFNHDIDVPEGASAVNGLTREFLAQNGKDPKKTMAKMIALIEKYTSKGVPLVAFNLPYDATIARTEALRLGLEPMKFGPALDGRVLDKELQKRRRGPRKLINVAAHYGVELSEDDAHGAGADAQAAVEVVRAIADFYIDKPWGKILTRDLDRIHEKQIEWFAEQCNSLQHYLRTSGVAPDANVEREWPILPLEIVTYEATAS